jgi:ATP-dependent Clp protease adaptor protein ClpS
MPDQKPKTLPDGSESRDGGGQTATLEPKRKRKTRPNPRPPGLMPLWKVLLHNDDKNTMDHVILTIVDLTPLKEEDAVLRTLEADKTGVALLLVTHKERAELYQEQFQSKSLTVTIEPDE